MSFFNLSKAWCETRFPHTHNAHAQLLLLRLKNKLHTKQIKKLYPLIYINTR